MSADMEKLWSKTTQPRFHRRKHAVRHEFKRAERKTSVENIPSDMRECVEQLARAGRSDQRIAACTGIPKLIVLRVLLEMESAA